MLSKVSLLFNTIKYLKVVQITSRVKQRFNRSKIDLTVSHKTSELFCNLEPLIECKQRMFDTNKFKFLNRNLNLKQDWNSKNEDKLILYNLHYFDDLNAVDSSKRHLWHSNLITKWIDENPIGYGNGWESYPLSLRLVNWIKWSLKNEDFKQKFNDSLVHQARYLLKNLEFHLLGNHLFKNAKALIFAGLYFEGNEANNWYEVGKKILIEELSEQILQDGGHFELSPMYHSIFLEDLLDLINIHKAFNKLQPENLTLVSIKMLRWLDCMSHPDKKISFFNDSAFEISPTIDQQIEYANRLGVVYESNLSNFEYLKDSGYFRIKLNDLLILLDVAKIGPDYIPGHGHADALSFEMSLYGRRLIVNSGISTYNIGKERDIQRGTISHSTIVVDDHNSSEIWSGFRVAKRANIFNIRYSHSSEFNEMIVSACHDGYKRLKNQVHHCRKWKVTNNLIEIRDKLNGKGNHKVESVFPLHPEVLVKKIENSSVYLDLMGKSIKIIFSGNGSLRLKESTFNPEFGVSLENHQIIYSYNGALPLIIKTKISW